MHLTFYEGCVSIRLEGDHPCAVAGSSLLALQLCFSEKRLPDPLLLHEGAVCCLCICPDCVETSPVGKNAHCFGWCLDLKVYSPVQNQFFPVICNVSIILHKLHAERSQTRDVWLG